MVELGASAGGSTLGSVIVVWLLGVWGVQVPNEVAAAMTGVVMLLAGVWWRYGLVGIATHLLHGDRPPVQARALEAPE